MSERTFCSIEGCGYSTGRNRDAIVRMGNARVRGDFDISEINRIMGW